MSFESHLACGAEDTAHRTAGLRRNAKSATPVVAHQHGFDDMPIVQFEERLSGLFVTRIKIADRFDANEIQLSCHLIAQRLWKPGKLRRGIIEMLIQSLPDLPGAIGRFAP